MASLAVRPLIAETDCISFPNRLTLTSDAEQRFALGVMRMVTLGNNLNDRWQVGLLVNGCCVELSFVGGFLLHIANSAYPGSVCSFL